MKKKYKSRIFAVAVLIAMSLIACPTPDGGNGKGDNDQTPTAADFAVSGLSQIYDPDDNSPKTVTITPMQGKSTGEITIYYNGLKTAPSAIGSYPVTFDVAASVGWNAASALIAGTLEIAEQSANAQTPTAADFEIGNLSQTAESVTAVTIAPKQGKSGGKITVYYNGSETIPQTAGNYTVTFKVSAAVGWNEASNLSAGTLTITSKKPDEPGKVKDETKFVMDISKTTDWDYLVFCNDGSSMVLNVNENTGLPTIAYVKPKKDSDVGFTFLFKEDGLPHMMVFDDYTFYFSNFNGYTFDMAVIHPDYQSPGRSIQGRTVSYDYMELCRNIQVEMDWDVYNEMLMHDYVWDPLLKTVSFSLDVLGKALGTVVCASASAAFPPTMVGCGIFILSTGTGIVVEIAAKQEAMSGTAKDALQTILSGLGCVTADVVDCLSTAAGIFSMLSDHDLAKLIEKAKEAAEARKAIDGSKNSAVTGVNLSNNAMSLAVDNYGQLTAAVLPSNATEKFLTWTTSNANVATVRSNGLVYANAPGTATITVSTFDGNYKASCAVTVTAPIAVTGITLNKARTSLAAGQTETLTPAIQPSNATHKNVVWTSSNPNVAKMVDFVSDYRGGTVEAVAPGTAVITVRTVEGGYTATCTVTVTSVAVTGVTLDKPTLSLAPGVTVGLTATVQPPNASNKNLVWTTSNANIATVRELNDDIWVTGVAEGTAVITVRTVDGNKTATCAISVTKASTTKGIVEMVQIPAGTFMMGSNWPGSSEQAVDLRGEYSPELPQHQVTMSAFSIGKYEVTQKQWLEVMGTTILQQPTWISSVVGKDWSVEYFGDGSYAINGGFYAEHLLVGDNYPMYFVSWYDALVFCNRLSMIEGLSPAYRIAGSTNPADWGSVPYDTTLENDPIWDAVTIVAGSTGYRLPTEAQWEYACRAGTTTPFNTGGFTDDDLYQYLTVWTDQEAATWAATWFKTIGWHYYNSGMKAHPVGLMAPNAWGLYDMHGNVSEYCWDWYGPYSSGSQTNPTGPGPDSGNPDYDYSRVMRGGSFFHWPEWSRSAFRGTSWRISADSVIPNPGQGWLDTAGFRVVRP